MGNFRKRKHCPPGAWGGWQGEGSEQGPRQGLYPAIAQDPPPQSHLVFLGHCEDEAVEVAGAPMDEIEAILWPQPGPHE